MRYRRRRSESEDVQKAAGVAAAAGLGLAAVLFYLVWNWLRREPLRRESTAPRPKATGEPPSSAARGRTPGEAADAS